LKISAAHPEEKLGGAQLTQRFYDLQCESRLAEGVILQTNSLQCRPELVIGLVADIASGFAF
jgi:hypothetical protein